MSKQLTFNYGNTEYVLEFTRKTVEQLERQGFIADDFKTKPMTTLPILFAGAFLANHRYVKKETIDEIYSKMPNKAELINRLAEMYNEPILSLIDEPESTEGNVEWTTSW